MNRIIHFFLHNRLITFVVLLLLVCWGITTAPFNWQIAFLPSDPVAVDAIPDIGENQQIVFKEWKGRSPQDIEDQISYPLTTYLLGIPGVKSIISKMCLCDLSDILGMTVPAISQHLRKLKTLSLLKQTK